MDGIVPFLILLAMAAILSGPIALIVAIVSLKRIDQMRRQLDEATTRTAVPIPKPPTAPAAEPSWNRIDDGDEQVRTAPARAYPSNAQAERITPCGVTTNAETVSLEQRIGTRWALVAGVVTVIFAVGFFLKYAYENQWIGPWGRMMIAGFSGLAALAIGEVTRRRGYDFVAKGVTAMGFAILYATVFAAHRWYGLIGPVPTYVLAVGVTVAAMSYAVVLDEVAIALLSLAGGYLTPIMLSTGQNLPNPLFAYVLILSAGAMLCAYWRKWSPVNILAFIGTYLLYTAWFDKFYRPVMDIPWPPPQLGVATFWLAVFFLVFLVLPVLHTLLRRVRSQVQDTLLVLANAAVVFYYLWTMLTDGRRDWLALSSVVMGLAYLGLMGLATLRCRADGDLRNALLITGVAFLSLAVPLHFEANAIPVMWAVEAVALAAMGLRYRNSLVQAAGGAVLAMAIGKLLVELPMHAEPFRPVLNVVFGAWCFVAAAAIVCHALYRFNSRIDPTLRQTVAQVAYTVGLLLLMAAIGIELWSHEDVNQPAGGTGFFLRQMPLVFAAFILLFAARPLCPQGRTCRAVAVAMTFIGSLSLAMMYKGVRDDASVLFLNSGFVRAMTLVAAVFAAACLLRRAERESEEPPELPMPIAMTGILVLWAVMTEEIWFHYAAHRATGQWRVLAQMYISVLWAVYATALMIVGFWKRVRPLRYVALGIFLLLLAKIFLVDTRTVETIYRIAGFLVTGLTLVGVSYLYQYLKRKGFFEAIR
jgi:uncharacterized membrane protein